jgi:NCS1 family nucleobase:cation symporter-1
MLNSIFPTFLRMKNTLPTSAGITTPDLIGFLVYMALFTPIVMIPPHKLGRLLLPVFGVTCVTFAGILGWALHANGGPGNLVSPAITITPLAARYAFVQGIVQVGGAYTGGSVRLSDWTRFTATPMAPRVGMVIAQPLSMVIGALIGVLVTSATNELYG